ncbi:CHAT domain-containing protein [Synechocystis sp. PCC 7509]|uniref:CHAT domain-containing protein n=1 Tax=Synechocystis sp. PCC 7509 TaxID=927677 RepID=UPI00048B29A9|nr:CHAT domain-containing protein [Synechocystis sp. PCC 7509]
MGPKRLIANRLNWRSHNRIGVKLAKGITLVLLALLIVTSVLALSVKQVPGIEPLPSRSSSLTAQADRAVQPNIEGQKLYESGQFSEAIEAWQKAIDAYAQVGNPDGITQSRINISQALQALGFYPRACNTLLQAFNITNTDCQKLTQSNEDYQQRHGLVLKTLDQIPNSQTKTIGLRSLGDVLQKLDNLDMSAKVLQLSLETARALRSPQNESAALLSLGNTFQAWGNRARANQDTASEIDSTPWHCPYSPSLGVPKKFYQQAASFYQLSANKSVSSDMWVQAQVNHLGVMLETDASLDAKKLWLQLQPRLEQLPASQAAIYARLNLAISLSCLKEVTTTDAPSWLEIAQTLATAQKQAQSLGESRSQAYTLGYLGGLYAQAQTPSSQNLNYATELTRQALVVAQAANATDIAYKWQWQLGYLLKTQGDIKGAIAAYSQAIDTLQSLRSDLTASSANLQFSFQESVEPVYRQLVDLLLQSSEQKKLTQARHVIEALQLAQLENLLRCRLQSEASLAIDHIDPTAAIIYPIILADRIEVIVSLANQPLQHYSSSLSQEQNIEDRLATLRQNLQSPNSFGPGFLKLLQQTYDWIIKPVEAELEKNKIETLVFVLDGALRQIPMAALHDGRQYLIEKYAVALSPSLQLLQPKLLPDRQLKVLAAGISQKIPGYNAPALPEVKEELEQISQIPTSVVLRNKEFTRNALASEINEIPFSVVHLATHGQFSSSPDQTYIRAWDDSININQLRNLLQTRETKQTKAIELLVLSACDTASGDRRSALGLAGVAVRAGARSTLASLWQVNDNSTALLMKDFYKMFLYPSDSEITKVKALQNAQINLLHKYKSPFYWASYVLVGNWL